MPVTRQPVETGESHPAETATHDIKSVRILKKPIRDVLKPEFEPFFKKYFPSASPSAPGNLAFRIVDIDKLEFGAVIKFSGLPKISPPRAEKAGEELAKLLSKCGDYRVRVDSGPSGSVLQVQLVREKEFDLKPTVFSEAR